jgi:hypothetical protein
MTRVETNIFALPFPQK